MERQLGVVRVVVHFLCKSVLLISASETSEKVSLPNA